MMQIANSWRRRIGTGAVLAGLLLAATALSAQVTTPRIRQSVDDSTRVTLRNNVSRVLRSATDLGAVSDSTAIEHVRLLLQRSDEQTAALDQYLAEVQQKSSSNYHKWLTPEQFGKLYGPADSDIAVIESWLQSKGFTGIEVSKGRTTVDFSGSAATVQEAFQTSIHSFVRNGREFYSNTSDPTIPAALSSVISGIAHLNSFGPRPLSHAARPGVMDPETKKLTALSATSGPSPALTYTSSSSNYLYLVPGDAATIYNTPNSTLNANYSGTSYTGSGVSIGIIGDAAISTTPVTNYRTKFLGETTPTAPTIIGSTSSTSDADEAYLDVEISGGLAPGATIHFYTGSDGSLATQIEAALSANTVDILSVSFGLCEQYMSTSDNAIYSGYWQQAAAQGIAVTVSSGDNGSAGCDYVSDSSGNYTTAATGGLGVNGLASTLYNIAVGGTDFALTQSNYTTYANTSNSSTTYYRTAKSYIPETTWNDSTQSNTTISADVPWTSSTSPTQNILAGSGGKSSCKTNTTGSSVGTCTSGYSKPSWQRGTGVPSDSVRDVPDISLMSGVGYVNAAWLMCTNDTYTSGSTTYTTNCATSGSSTSWYFSGVGGTSAAAPAFAGILALVQESQGGGRLGQAAANLYNVYNNSASSSTIFHDITTGNISVPCTSGTSNCSQNTAGYYFLTGYNTNTGYDLATGMGSLNAAALISNWSSGMGTATATVTVTPASSSVNLANTLSVSVAVSGSSGTPTGSVTLSSGSYSSSAADLSSGSATIVIPANSLTAGTATLTATYSGSGVYSSATGTSSVTVTGTSLTTTTTALAASSTTPTYGTTVTFTATVTPTAASGTVLFYDGGTLLASGTLSSGTASYPTSALSVGTHSFTAVYAGDTTYASSSSSAVSVTVSSSSSGTGSFSLSATNITVSQGNSGASTVTVTPANSYTGTVGFTLSTSSTSLQNYGCYTISDASVTSTSAVTKSLTIYTSESTCNSVAAVTKNAVQKFNGSLRQISATQPAPSTGGKSLPFGLAAAAGVLLLGMRRRAKWITTLGCVLLLAGLGLAVGCGGSSSSSSGNKVAKGSYTVTVTGADTSSSSITASTDFTLTVN
jgi:trimeric autotransporter adhesin